MRKLDIDQEDFDDEYVLLLAEVMPKENPDYARAVYEYMGASTDPKIRSNLEIMIDGIMPVDHDLGMRLWTDLLREGRIDALQTLGDIVSKLTQEDWLSPETPAALSEKGLTFRDIAWLTAVQVDQNMESGMTDGLDKGPYQ